MAVNTAIFAFATALSRIAGLGREVVQAAYFATSAAASAFTLASQVPNLFSNLFSQAALSAAFVPVFTELLSKGRKREAFRVASTLFWVILIALGALTVVWTLVAGLVVPAFTGSHIPNALTAGLSRVLFPVVLLLSLTGLLVGILQSYDEFTIPAIAPAVWNLVILAGLIALHSRFHGDNKVYAYAIAWLVATVVQFLMVFVALRRIEFKVSFVCDWRDPRVKQVLILFIPVTISIGIVNLDIFLNAGFGSLVSSAAPAAINDAFRIYMLPQGIFSVAVATVLFPTLSRMAAGRDANGMRRTVGNGMRQINLLLIPSSALLVVLATPITRLVYQHGTFHSGSTDLVSTALFWFSFSLPFAGVNLLLSRTFFALQRPWIPTKLAAMNMVVDVIVSVALYKPLGHRGTGDRDRGRQHRDDRAPAVPAADRVQRLSRGRADADDHRADPGGDRDHGRDGPGHLGRARPPARRIRAGADLLGRDRVRGRVRALREAHADDARPRGAADPGAGHGAAAPGVACGAAWGCTSATSPIPAASARS